MELCGGLNFFIYFLFFYNLHVFDNFYLFLQITNHLFLQITLFLQIIFTNHLSSSPPFFSPSHPLHPCLSSLHLKIKEIKKNK